VLFLVAGWASIGYGFVTIFCCVVITIHMSGKLRHQDGWNEEPGFWILETVTIPLVPLDNRAWKFWNTAVGTPSRNQYPPRFMEDWASGSYFQGTQDTLKSHLYGRNMVFFCLLGDALLSKNNRYLQKIALSI
jgi:hypothetical protein